MFRPETGASRALSFPRMRRPARLTRKPTYRGRLWFSTLLGQENNAALSDEVVRLMNEAVGVAEDPRWISSRQPAFTWASEAKVACGKAYGYLKASYRDEDSINRCECFHSRMLHYMN